MLNLFIVLAGLVLLIVSVIFGIVLPIGRGTPTPTGIRQVPPAKVHILRGIIGATIGAVIMIIGFAGPFVEVPCPLRKSVGMQGDTEDVGGVAAHVLTDSVGQ